MFNESDLKTAQLVGIEKIRMLVDSVVGLYYSFVSDDYCTLVNPEYEDTFKFLESKGCLSCTPKNSYWSEWKLPSEARNYDILRFAAVQRFLQGDWNRPKISAAVLSEVSGLLKFRDVLDFVQLLKEAGGADCLCHTKSDLNTAVLLVVNCLVRWNDAEMAVFSELARLSFNPLRYSSNPWERAAGLKRLAELLAPDGYGVTPSWGIERMETPIADDGRPVFLLELTHQKIWVRHAPSGKSFAVKSLRFDSSAQRFMDVCLANPNATIPSAEFEGIGRANASELVGECGFKGPIRKAFFPGVSKTGIRFRNPVTLSDLEESGILETEITDWLAGIEGELNGKDRK